MGNQKKLDDSPKGKNKKENATKDIKAKRNQLIGKRLLETAQKIDGPARTLLKKIIGEMGDKHKGLFDGWVWENEELKESSKRKRVKLPDKVHPLWNPDIDFVREKDMKKP
ncbi:hypothetical protein [Entomobacter blattae]|uniref:Uncharacterized protein n=1 Tax=Entomobacter blattae TaxID=2762277 RepID=A0A7H1NPS0_9PROT|nr:hypothetical protein [Entomobacter blattae]QNT77780.1 hypothetical protein JGUZn3_05340 [Entomobacter blattae]